MQSRALPATVPRMHSRARLLAIALAASSVVFTALASCTSNVPVGFGSGTSVASRDVVATPSAVIDATHAVLAERGDAVETETAGDATVIRTGRFRIRIEPREGGSTHLHIEIARYVGSDNQQRVDDTLEQILEGLR